MLGENADQFLLHKTTLYSNRCTSNLYSNSPMQKARSFNACHTFSNTMLQSWILHLSAGKKTPLPQVTGSNDMQM